MIARCENKESISYKNYGGRGVNVCERWHDFNLFVEDMDSSYFKGATIERIDNDKGYEPNNCRWATKKEQGNNRRNNHILTYNGKSQTVSQWAEDIGVKRDTLYSRLFHGYPVEIVLQKNLQPGKKLFGRKIYSPRLPTYSRS